MDRAEAKRLAKYLKKKGHYAIQIREDWPERDISVFSLNRTGTHRLYDSLDDAKKDCESIEKVQP